MIIQLLAAALAGALYFLVVPFVPALTGAGQQLVRPYLLLAMAPLKRAAIVVSEHGDVVFKPMTFNSRGVELISLDGVEKEFEDPDNALHTWLGTPFALADERSGVLFDPRHALIGEQKTATEDLSRQASDDDWQQHGVGRWEPATFEITDTLATLSKVRECIDGGERAEYPKRVEKLYENSRSPFSSALSNMRLLLPAVAFVITFGGIWAITNYLTKGSGGSDSTTVSYGVAPLAAALATHKPSADSIATLATAGLPPVAAVCIATVAGPFWGIATLVCFILGFAALPVLAMLSQPIPPLASLFSSLNFTLAFAGTPNPTLTWTRTGYQLRSGPSESQPRYKIFGQRVGFDVEHSEDAWPEAVSHDRLAELRAPATDGGDCESAIPAGWTPAPLLDQDIYGAIVPTRLRDSAIYIKSADALARLTGAADGTKSFQRLMEAKEDGEDALGISDRLLLYATSAGGLVGVVMGALLFL
jgi:hypothetical protein